MSQTKVPYVINLFGSAIQLWELCLSPTLQMEMLQYKDSKGLVWHDLLFDLELIRKFKVKHWTEIAQKVGGSELMLNSEARIELRKNGRMAERIIINELLRPSQLFAKYNTRQVATQVSAVAQLIIIEEVKGQIAKFAFEAPHFEMEQLEFCIKTDQYSTMPRLSAIAKQQTTLVSSKEDVLVLCQRVEEQILL